MLLSTKFHFLPGVTLLVHIAATLGALSNYHKELREGFKKKSHKLGLFAQPPLTPPSLLNLGPLSDYTFLALKTLFKGKNALCLRLYCANIDQIDRLG